MWKIGKKFVASLVVFTSIVSFLPIDLLNSGQAVEAAEVIRTEKLPSGYEDESKIKFSVRKSNDPNSFGTEMLPDSVVDGNNVYSQKDGGITNYKLVLDDIRMSENDLKEKLKTEAVNAYEKLEEDKKPKNGINYTMTAIVAEKVNITSINQIDLTNNNKVSEIEDKLGIKIIDDNVTRDQKSYIVKTITNVPYGINQITYDIKYTLVTYSYNPIKDANTGVQESGRKQEEKSLSDQNKLYIYNGTNFANNQVSSLIFEQYVGAANDLNNPDMQKNNKRPFLYKSKAYPDKNVPLRYEWRVPDSTTALRYNFTFESKLDNGANVYVGGRYSDSVDHTDYTISGALTDLNNTSNFIVVKFNTKEVSGETGTLETMTKSYSIELSYTTKNSNEDNTIMDAGIKKLDADDNDKVEAWIGKTFTHEIVKPKDGSGEYDEFKGEITIDNRASMISINPELVRGKENVAYKIQNSYTKSGKTGIRESIMKNGKQYVEFNYGDTNELQLFIYAGDGNGNINYNAQNGKEKLLAIYYLTVKTSESNGEFKTKLAFDGDDENDGTYLTQEGVKENVIPFSPNRTNYGLYTKSEDNLEIALTERSSNNEYIRVFYSDGVSGDSFTEYKSSASNNISPESGKRSNVINVEPGKHKRIKVQAYYDKLNPKEPNEPYTVEQSYPLGEEYIFYLGDNIKQGEENNTINKSEDASLSNIKIKGETLYDLDGNKGFKSDTYDYKVKVDKETKTALITLTPEDENVKSMTATVTETGAKYDFYSGEEIEVTLNGSGTTSLNIEVTAQDGKTVKVYNIVIVNNTKGGSAKLKNLILSTGDFTFNPSEYETKVLVDQTTKKVSITPVAEDSKAKITVNGQSFSGTPIEVNIKGAQKTEVEIVVTSEDGKNSKTYTLIIKRVTSINDSEDPYGREDDSYYDYDNDIWIDNSKYDEWGTTSDGRVVYYDTKGRQVKDAWIQTGNKYYYVNKSGYRATGWKIDSDGKTYYLDPSTGEMKTGWIYVNGSTYYLNPRGIMQKGWLNVGNKWYYFTANGQMVANTSMYIDERLYKFTQDGVMYY